MLDSFLWFVSITRFLTTPSIVPIAGGVAAMVTAVLSCERKRWRNPAKMLWTAVKGLVIWIIVVWLMSVIFQFGNGDGDQTGAGDDKTDAANADDSGSTNMQTSVTSGTVVVQSFASDMTLMTDLSLQFVPSPANPEMPLPFACDLLIRDLPKDDSGGEGGARRIQIRAPSVSEFETALVAQLMLIAEHSDTSLTVTIGKEPFPGNRFC